MKKSSKSTSNDRGSRSQVSSASLREVRGGTDGFGSFIVKHRKEKVGR